MSLPAGRLRSFVLVLAVIAPVSLPPASAQVLEDTVALQKRLDEALAAGDRAAALGIAERLAGAAEEQHVDALVRVARLHCQLGHPDDALSWLERAHATGYVDVYALRKDEGFACLRGDERFTKLSRAIWAKGYIAMLERPERDDFQQPDAVMAALALRPGERVADIGAGSGYFTRRVAHAVGPTGVVWAIDIAQEMLDYLAARAAEEKLAIIRLVKVERDDPRLPEGQVDTVLLVDTLHYIKERGAYCRKLRPGLAPGGRVVVIDYIPKPWEERPWGPPPEQKMSREEVDAAMAEAGLVPVRVHDFLTEQFFVEYRAAPTPAS
jgi:SAM-dependent methyltransferase